MLYLDSSAAVKLYVAESRTAQVRAAVLRDPPIVSARITFVEVLAALEAATRAGRIADLAAVAATFRAHWRAYVIVEIDRVLAESAAELARRHALRAYDAIQLAAALTAAGGDPSVVHFGAFDQALARAAVAEGLRQAI